VQTATQRPVIWAIAGSDCSGGSGIQADIKTAHILGCEVCSFITANTVQNANEMIAINPTSVDILQEQWFALAADKAPDVIKIGMIANNEQLYWLRGQMVSLKKSRPEVKVVWDPVLQASVGGALSESPLDIKALTSLLAWVDVICPNQEEAAYLTGEKGQSEQAGFMLDYMQSKLACVVITGGVQRLAEWDDERQVVDVCYQKQAKIHLSSKAIKTAFSHGSGCTFSTAMASHLAKGAQLETAFRNSKAFMNKAFTESARFSGANLSYGAIIQPALPIEAHYFPQDFVESEGGVKFADLGTDALKFYPMVDSIDELKKLLPLGLEIIQLRLKHLSKDDVRLQIERAVFLSKNYQTRLFIKDYWQDAIEFGAYGVHLDQQDLASADLTAIHEAGLRLGVSTHEIEAPISKLNVQPSYFAIGPIFPTRAKALTEQVEGVENLKTLLKHSEGLPIVAMGGITLDNANTVLATGVQSIAVETAVTQAADPVQAAASFQSLFNN